MVAVGVSEGARHRADGCAECAARPRPADGDAYRAYALISNALAVAFSQAGLFVNLSRREHMAATVWADLTSHELRAPVPEDMR